jgi:hypothetical protein
LRPAASIARRETMIREPLAMIVGANLMFGKDDYTFFGQLEQNTNVYGWLRYSF